MKRLGCYLLAILVVVGIWAAFHYLELWQVLVLVVGLAVVVKFGGRWLISSIVYKLFMAPFKLKGAVLKNAAIAVHSLSPAEAPPPPAQAALEDRRSPEEKAEDDEDLDDEDDSEVPADTSPRDYYRLEVTITPAPTTGPFQLWEPGELMLVLPGKTWDDDDDNCEINQVEIEEDGQFKTDDGMKYPGAQLRLLIGIRPGTEKLAFRYYMEEFGAVQIYQRDIRPQ